ncbi:TPA: hypothetical protein ACGUPG_004335 [Vibrio vulnificus]|uniref:hypothetical protein n=1 Tax=Vibrio TaxID=662 RepID=UPI0003FA929E|nr:MULTISPECIES: hypothetical protein [Vibrio]MCC3817965.1 hypothetical protein [Vibrio parahaemolyticus]MCC3854641.1 hypothetical protein [Vibrio parahaemolyticus]
MKKDTFSKQQSNAIERLKAMLEAQKAGDYRSPNKANNPSERDFSRISEETVYASL